MSAVRPKFRVITPDATDDEVAAIVAAVSALSAAATARPGYDDTLHEWVHGTRLAARAAGLQRGPWRLSGRIGRRSRA
jgi:hypothetical protein